MTTLRASSVRRLGESAGALAAGFGVLTLGLTGCTALPWIPGPLRGDTSEVAPPRPSPKSFSELLSEADRSRDAGDLPRATWKYLQALRTEPGSPLPAERIGLLLLANQDYEQARINLESVVLANPDSALARYGLGLALLQTDDLSGAETHLTRARELDPNNVRMLIALGVLYDRRADHAAAIQLYREGLALDPNNPDLYNNLGMSFLMSDQPTQAIQPFQRAAKLDPRDKIARNNLGIAYGRLGWYDEALTAFREVGAEDLAQNNLGLVCYLNGEEGRAMEAFERALRLAPADRRLPIIQNIRRLESTREGPRP